MERISIYHSVKDHIKIIKDQESIIETDKLEDLGLDSLDQVELFMMMEKEFKFRMSDEDMAYIKTVGQTIDVIQKHLPA